MSSAPSGIGCSQFVLRTHVDGSVVVDFVLSSDKVSFHKLSQRRPSPLRSADCVELFHVGDAYWHRSHCISMHVPQRIVLCVLGSRYHVCSLLVPMIPGLGRCWNCVYSLSSFSLVALEGTQIFCGKIYQRPSSSDSMGQSAADLDCVVTPIGTGRDVVTNLAVSCAHSHLFIALADGHCMRWSFSASSDPTCTVVIEHTSDLVFQKTSDVRLGPIHSMHASPYGSFLTMTRSSQNTGFPQSLRMSKAVYIQRCNTDTVVFPVSVAAATACFIIPWNGAAALELYSTCQRTPKYWSDTLHAIWSLVCQTTLPLENAFRALQVGPCTETAPSLPRSHPPRRLCLSCLRDAPLHFSPSTAPSCAPEGALARSGRSPPFT